MNVGITFFQRRVTLHVTFLKIGEINTLKEQFDADVLIRTRWREPELDGHSDEVGHFRPRDTE